MPIETPQQLRAHLQTALELEHATIPAYLSAMYTIKPGTNQEAYDVIRSVVLEEMLHLTLAANVLNAVGGRPSLNHPQFVPRYPTHLPHSSQAFWVQLQKFSPEAIETFLKIERPAKPHAPPEADHYHTIGQFYEAIEEGLKQLTAAYGELEIFCGDPQRQVTPAFYYGGGGGVVAIPDSRQAEPGAALAAALEALTEITEQGEGLDHTIWDGDAALFGQAQEVAHYFRFKQILCGRYYQPGDTVNSDPSGPPLEVDWDQVYKTATNPKTKDYPPGSEVRRKSHDFNLAYSELLNQLHDAFNGQPALLVPAVGRMFDLKYKALALIKNPWPGQPGLQAGPTFEYLSAEAVIEQLNAYFGSADLEGLLSLLADDVVWEVPGPAALPYAGVFTGHQGFKTFWRKLHQTVNVSGGGSEQLIQQRHSVVSLGREEGTVKATGKPYHYRWAQVYTLDKDYKIKRMYQYFNPLNILTALNKGEKPMSDSPYGRPLPPLPPGFQMPFYYASLTNCGVFYLVDPDRLRPYLEETGLRPALFDARGVVSFNYQLYTGQFPFGANMVTEIELNIVAFPESEADNVADVTFEQFVLGDEQTRLLGNHRVHVPCDNDIAINAGKELFGEPKFKTTFTTNVPSLNDPSVKTWQITCNDPKHPDQKDHYIFSVEVDLQNFDSTPGNFSPITEYGTHEGQLIAARWSILQPMATYFLKVDQQSRVNLTFGKSHHPMHKDMEILIGDQPAAAVRAIQSPPAAIQSRAYYP